MSGIVSIAWVKNRGRLGSGRVKRLPDPCLPRFSLLRYCRAIFAIALFCSLTSRSGCWRANRLVFFLLIFPIKQIYGLIQPILGGIISVQCSSHFPNRYISRRAQRG